MTVIARIDPLLLVIVCIGRAISVLCDPDVFLHSMSAETFEGRQLSYSIFYYRWRPVS